MTLKTETLFSQFLTGLNMWRHPPRTVLEMQLAAIVRHAPRGHYRKIGISKNGNSFFFRKRTQMLTSFALFVWTYRGLIFLPKLTDILAIILCRKTEFPFFGIARSVSECVGVKWTFFPGLPLHPSVFSCRTPHQTDNQQHSSFSAQWLTLSIFSAWPRV